MGRGRQLLQIKGPSSLEMPRAFPPFLLKYEITALVMGCMTRAGRMPVAFKTPAISATKRSRILTWSSALFLNVAVVYVSL